MRLVLIIFCVFFLFFAPAQNDLRLSTLNGAVFTTFLNDSAVNDKPQASVFIKGIKKDTVKIKIEFENKLTATQTIYFLEKGKPTRNAEFDYLVETKNNKVKIVFYGTQSIMTLPDPLIPKKPIVDTGNKYRNNVLGHYVELKNAKPTFFNNLPKTGDCKTAMPAEYLNYLNILMSKSQIEDDKFNIAENTTRNNCISVYQLNKILKYITFELEKLKLIKLSYYHLIDKENKYNLDSTFKLESSKRELESFLKIAEKEKPITGTNCVVASKDGEMGELYNKLSVYLNDPEKYMFLKKSYTNYCYSVNQVKLLLGLFLHDREKTDAAKLLYFYCTEKENFLAIGDVFSYNSSVADLKEFVEKQKN